MGQHGARPPIIPSLKLSDCTEIISREIDSGISLQKKKILATSGGFFSKEAKWIFPEPEGGKERERVVGG